MKPSENALIKAKRANKQLTRNDAKRIQRRKNIANQIKAFAILGGWACHHCTFMVPKTRF